MKELLQTILFKIKQAKGNRIPISSLLLVEKKRYQKREKPRKSGKPSSQKQTPAGGLWDLIHDLENFALIERKKDNLYPRHPFLVEARLSVTPTGIAFAMGSFDKDIFISRQRRQGANHRDKVWIEITGFSRNRYEGRVASVIETFSTEYFAKVEKKQNDGYLITLCDLPDSPFGYVKLRNLKTQVELIPGDYIIIEETGETRDVAISPHLTKEKSKFADYSYQELAVYEYVSTLLPGDLYSDTKRVALRYNIPLHFEPEQLPIKKELKKLVKQGRKESQRKDLTKLHSFTIDGADSKDFDDAISLVEKDNKMILYVHIADVSHFVTVGSNLDIESYKRGNSYYLSSSVFPMLPAMLSEEFCSLNPKTKRLAFTVEMHYDDKGDLLDYHIYKSFIHLTKRYTYEDAENDLYNPKSILSSVWKLAMQINRQRIENGKVELNIRETQIITDAHGRIKAMDDKVKLHSYKLIEECMLSANTCTANFMKKKKIPGLFRVHDPLPKENLKKLNLFLELYGFRTRIKNNTQEEILRVANLVDKTQYTEIFQKVLLRTFSQAVYSTSHDGHWGLAFKDYAHFTSPIRRFSDLVVHRQIGAYIANQRLPYSRKELKTIATDISRLERIAMEAEKAIIRLMSIRYIHSRPDKQYDAKFSGFNSNGLFISIEDPRVEGFILFKDLSPSASLNSVDDFRIVLPRFKKTISIGQNLKVELIKADWEKMQIYFNIISVGKLLK